MYPDNVSPVGNMAKKFTIAPVVQAAAYAAGACVGGKLTLANAARGFDFQGTTIGIGGMIQGVVLGDKSGHTTVDFDVIFFDADPAGSTLTDKVVIAVAAADLGKIIGVAHITDWTLGAAATMSIGQDLTFRTIPFVCADAALYAAIVARGAITFLSVDDVRLKVHTLQD